MSFHIDKSIPKQVADVMREGYKKVDDLWPISQTISFVSNSGRTRNGYCKKVSKDFYTIAINRDIVNPQDILDVVVHELLHSYPEVFPQGHKGEWKKRAEIVNNVYGLHIQRVANYKRSQTYAKRKTNYIATCSKCHSEWEYTRLPKWHSQTDKVKCPYCRAHTISLKGTTDPFAPREITKF